jgi:hypothetical protein
MQSLDETAAPTGFPTAYPTASPTEAPTAYPTAAPTPAPTEYPTAAPTKAPTAAPTKAPTVARPAGPVDWTSFHNIDDLSWSAGTLTRTSGFGWDAGAISQQTIQQSSAPQGVQVRFTQDESVGARVHLSNFNANGLNS